MGKEFDNILNECLERLLVRGETIEQCLQRYPEQEEELRSLLQTALAAKEASAIQPRAEFKARARYQFRAALQEAASRRSRSVLGWFPRWATVVAIVLGLLLIGSGTVAAASYSMPDSILYPVKLATENVQLALTRSDLGKAELNANLADRRVAEIIYLVNKGDAKRIEVVTQRFDRCLAALTELASTMKIEEAPKIMASAPALAPSEEAKGDSKDVTQRMKEQARLRATMARYAVNQPAALRAVLDKAPESAKPALRQAIRESIAKYKEALDALE